MRWSALGLFALLVVSSFAAVPPTRAQRATPAEIAPLIGRIQWLNDKCRGGSGDDPATADYCAVRDRAVEQLRVQGWCWGPPEQPEAMKEWRACERAPSRAAACVASVDKYQRALAIAFVASICNLRSERYLGLFKQAQAVSFGGAACHQLSAAEHNQVNAEIERIYDDEQSKIGFRQSDPKTLAGACQALRSGQVLDDLDRLERQITLNYH